MVAGTSKGPSRPELNAVAHAPELVDEITAILPSTDRTSGFYVSTRNDEASLRVLVVESDVARARAMSRGLRRANEDVVYVKMLHSIDDARSAMRASHFDVLLVNVSSPDSTLDLDALERALTLAASAGDTAVVATGYSDDIELAALVCSKGAQDYLRIDQQADRDLLRIMRCAAERARRTFRLISDVYHDELTQLPNRRMLRRHFAEARYRAVHSVGTVALLMIDLDGFKAVNDTLGHAAGDELLIAVAGRLRSCVRDTDMVARVGGDEFVVLANSGPGVMVIDELRARIETALREPFTIAQRRVVIRASIGSALSSPERSCELAAMLRAADDEMYNDKRSRHS